MNIEKCTRCQFRIQQDSDLLQELAFNEDRYLSDLVKKAQQDEDSAIHKEAVKQMEDRLKNEQKVEEEEDSDTEGTFLSDEESQDRDAPGTPSHDIRSITEEDVKRALEEYENDGLIDTHKGKIIVTTRGVKKLAAGALERILKSLKRTPAGSQGTEKLDDLGIELSLYTRRYEPGDDYSSVDLERTAINALRRRGELKFEPEDFEVRESIRQSKLCAGIIVDESGSMRDLNKLQAAMETAMVLSKLIMREPENSLKVFIFAEEVKQIEPWDIVNEVISGGNTDIRAALAAFRRASKHEYGDKQAFLITDTEPNSEEGKYLSFKAAPGLIEEASRYRQENIGLNIIMLDEGPELKSLASIIAKRNLGRVFFTCPTRMGEVMVEDYLKGGRGGFSALRQNSQL